MKFKKYMSKKLFSNFNLGFTLFEVLVVIFIIALLSTMVIFSISNSRKLGRDSSRISDINQIQIALENYHQIEGQYPSNLTTGQPLVGSSSEVIYMNEIPQNPPYQGTSCGFSNYEYNYDEELDTYEIFFCLEGEISNLSSGFKAASPTGIRDWACGDILFDTRDGNTYSTLEINSQCWMGENLAYLPEVHSNADFVSQGSASLPGYGVYGYDGSDVSTAKAETNYSTYGVLYNWFAVNQTGSNVICPEGWHVSSNDELKAIVTYLGTDSGSKLSGEYDLWSDGELRNNANFGSSGFDAVPAGYRSNSNGSSLLVGTYSYFWASTESTTPGLSWFHFTYFVSTGTTRSTNNQAIGYSVRCISD